MKKRKWARTWMLLELEGDEDVGNEERGDWWGWSSSIWAPGWLA